VRWTGTHASRLTRSTLLAKGQSWNMIVASVSQTFSVTMRVALLPVLRNICGSAIFRTYSAKLRKQISSMSSACHTCRSRSTDIGVRLSAAVATKLAPTSLTSPPSSPGLPNASTGSALATSQTASIDQLHAARPPAAPQEFLPRSSQGNRGQLRFSRGPSRSSYGWLPSIALLRHVSICAQIFGFSPLTVFRRKGISVR
jgi:hypothetical protein